MISLGLSTILQSALTGSESSSLSTVLPTVDDCSTDSTITYTVSSQYTKSVNSELRTYELRLRLDRVGEYSGADVV